MVSTLLLAMGAKSPSHLHVAVERYAEAVRAVLAEADGDAAALGALPPGSWRGAAAALGASPGQVAMLEVRGGSLGGRRGGGVAKMVGRAVQDGGACR